MLLNPFTGGTLENITMLSQKGKLEGYLDQMQSRKFLKFTEQNMLIRQRGDYIKSKLIPRNVEIDGEERKKSVIDWPEEEAQTANS